MKKVMMEPMTQPTNDENGQQHDGFWEQLFLTMPNRHRSNSRREVSTLTIVQRGDVALHVRIGIVKLDPELVVGTNDPSHDPYIFMHLSIISNHVDIAGNLLPCLP
jgi:hypothetical protein